MTGQRYHKQWQHLSDVDLTGMDANISAVAQTAHTISSDIREYDSVQLHRQLTFACETEPARMAQVLMVLAAWVDPEERVSVRCDRVEAIAESRLNRATA